MKKKILSAIVAISAVTALVPATSAFAADVYTVNVHYDRSDTTGWDVWKWDADDTGSAVSFSNGVATWTTTDTETSKFIVRKSDWSDREDSAENPYDGSFGGDRSIDFSKAVGTVVDVYVAVGSTENTYKSSAPTEPATSEPTTSTPATSTPATSTPATSTPATSTPATSATTTEPNTETGVEGVAAVLGVAVVAAGAMIVAKKRK